MTYRPIPGKLTVDPQNRICTVVRYGIDGGGGFVEVRLAGSYGAHVRLPVSCIRPLTERDRRGDVAIEDVHPALLRGDGKP